jgi:transcriptional antiterminator NusG
MADEPSTSSETPQTGQPPPSPEAVRTQPVGGKAPPPELPEAPSAAIPEESDRGVATAVAEAPSNKRWYVVKVQSGREESIKDAIERRVKIEGLEHFFGQIIIPTEKVVEMRGNKRVTRQRKLFPGYLMVEVEYNDRILYLFRETSGVGDFVGGSVTHAPSPMAQHEVDRLIRPPGEKPKEILDRFEKGDRVKVKEGPFAGMEGEIREILEAKEKVRIELVIWNRPVPVELEYWQVEKV